MTGRPLHASPLLLALVVPSCGFGRPNTPPTAHEDENRAADVEGDGSGEQAALATPSGAGPSLLGEVDRELALMKASTYSHHTKVDEATGVFEYDCSGLLRYALSRVAPDALAAVRAAEGRAPRSSEFVSFFEGIPQARQQGRWMHLARVADLRPGDVIVWLKTSDSTSTNTGHTLVVHGSPTVAPERSNAFVVPIVDSTGHPHVPGDSRTRPHQTGLGSGEIALVTDQAGAPVAYQWSRRDSSPPKATTIMLARLR